ncbi:MAG: hypothetical protein DBY04_02620 [Clostridiales bacterium]|nr:MAG: hypothetical protein DBY04_02620 [Clostridiales bacterium]
MNILTDGRYNKIIEKAVSSYTGKPFHITAIKENKEGAMHPAALIEGDSFRVFVKAGTNSFSPEQFQAEAWELDYIRTHSDVKTPEVIAVVKEEDAVLLILEAIDIVTPETKQDWERLGQGLASLHRTENDRCGFEYPTYLGIFKQDNTWKDTWPEFYGECRLRDSMKMAVDAGNMTAAECAEVEALIAKLPSICPPMTSFSLLHGDPWIGNLLYDGKQLVAIDCSIYYGNREIDLTTVDFFCPVSPLFFEAYNEAYPIDPGFAERSDLWKINQWLGHVTLYADKFKGKLMDAVRKYI